MKALEDIRPATMVSAVIVVQSLKFNVFSRSGEVEENTDIVAH